MVLKRHLVQATRVNLATLFFRTPVELRLTFFPQTCEVALGLSCFSVCRLWDGWVQPDPGYYFICLRSFSFELAGFTMSDKLHLSSLEFAVLLFLGSVSLSLQYNPHRLRNKWVSTSRHWSGERESCTRCITHMTLYTTRTRLFVSYQYVKLVVLKSLFIIALWDFAIIYVRNKRLLNASDLNHKLSLPYFDFF